MLRLNNLDLWLVFTISSVAALVMGVVAYFFIAPAQRKKILSSSQAKSITEKPSAMENGFSSASTVNTISTTSINVSIIKENEETEDNVNSLFNFLQIIAAIFSSFAHGGNDVSNAVGPLVAIWLIYTEGSVLQTSETPIWVLLYGGIGIIIGLWIFGRRVVETVGTNLSKITPAT